MNEHLHKAARSGARRRRRHVGALLWLLPHLWPAGRPDLKARVLAALLLLVLAKIATIAMPFFYKAAVDVLSGADAPALPLLGAVPALLVLAYGLARVLMQVLAQWRDGLFAPVGQHAVCQVAVEIFAHLHRLSLRFHLTRRTGGLSRIVERGTKGVDFLLRFSLFNIAPTLIEVVLVAGVLLVKFDARYVVATLVTVVTYVAFTFAVTEWRTRMRREMNDKDNEANTRAIDSLLNFETVKYFGNDTHEARRYAAVMADYARAAVRSQTSLAVLNSGQAVLLSAGLVVMMLMAGQGVAAGRLTVGDFVLVNSLLVQLAVPLNMLGMVYREIRQAMTDMEAMVDLLGRAPEIADAPDARPLMVAGGAIAFEDVWFGYDPDRMVLRGVSFAVPAGQMVAIVGPTGAGKSTIARLLYRFYDVTAGRIVIDGQDLRAVSQASLRAAIGIVPQDTVLFNDTIGYNIGYGRPGAEEAEIVAAARQARLHDFIAALPQGYRSMVGERGLKLSGGEKQRVAIARTLLKDPPILVLDEATSALDTRTEREIQAALRAARRARTTLVIAHRLSTIAEADEILVLDRGRIVERGRHAALLAEGGLYATLWREQQKENAAAQARQAQGEAVPASAEPPLSRHLST